MTAKPNAASLKNTTLVVIHAQLGYDAIKKSVAPLVDNSNNLKITTTKAEPKTSP